MLEFTQEDKDNLQMIKDSIKLNQNLYFKLTADIMQATAKADDELKDELIRMKYEITRTINHLYDGKKKLENKRMKFEATKQIETDIFKKNYRKDL